MYRCDRVTTYLKAKKHVNLIAAYVAQADYDEQPRAFGKDTR